jgi:archaellum component FlaF (FlaF/FlaG flagellin family)
MTARSISREFSALNIPYQNRAEVESARIPQTIEALMMLGDTTAGDGKGGIYQRTQSTTSLASGDDSFWQLVASFKDTHLTFYASDTTGTTDVTAELKSFIEANPNQYIFIPAGKYRINDLNPDASILLWAIPGSVTWLIDFNSSAIECSAQTAFVNSNTFQASVSAITQANYDDGFSQTINSDYVHKLTVGAGEGANFSFGDICTIHSNNEHPSGGSRWLGEGFKVLGVIGDDIYVQGVLAQASLYTTSIKVNKIPTTRRFSVTGFRFRAYPDSDSSWKDITQSITDGGGGMALNIWNFPYARVDDCIFEGVWSGTVIFRCCPFAKASNLTVRNLPNARTAIDNGRLGYGVSFYGHCVGAVAENITFEEGRHATTTDGNGGTYAASGWSKWGQPTYCTFRNITSYGAYGVPFDTHEEGNHIVFENCVAYMPYRGPQGGSYAGYGMQLRAQNCIVDNYVQIGGEFGIRIPATESPNCVHQIRSAYIANLTSSSENSYAIRHEDTSGLTNKPKTKIGTLKTRNVGRAIYANSGADIQVDNLIVEAIRARMIQCETGSKVHVTRMSADFRENPASAGTLNLVTLAGTSECYIGDLMLYQGATSSQPPRIFNNQDSATGKTVGLGRMSLIDPSAIGALEIVNITAQSNFTWLGGGRDTVFHAVDDSVTLVADAVNPVYTFTVFEPMYIRSIIAELTTTSSSGNVTVDIKRNGTSIFGANKLTIDASGKLSSASATAVTYQTATSRLKAGDVITVFVTAAGTGAKGLKIHNLGY